MDEKQKKTILCIVAILLTVCFLMLSSRVFLIVDRYFGKLEVTEDDNYAYKTGGRPQYLVNGKWYAQKDRVETYLLIGIDKYEAAVRNENGYRNHQQSDALFLIVVDRKDKNYSLIHINRDTMVNIQMLDLSGNVYSDFEGQIALSHTYGSGREDSCLNTVWSVSDFLYGLQIDHYISITMDAVEVLNDKIGGVTLTVLDDMTSVDKLLAEGKEVTLRGGLSLTYIRARSELADSTNVSRMKRQRQYVTAFLEQAEQAIAEDSSLAYDMVNEIADYLVSDLSVQELIAFADILDDYQFAGIHTIEGEARIGERFMEFYAEEQALQELVLSTFYEVK